MEAVDVEQGAARIAGSAAGLGEPVHLLDRGMMLAEQDQLVFVQILGPLRHAVFFQILGRRADMPVHCHQVPLHQIGLLGRMHADGDIGLPHRKIEFAVIQQQRDRYLGVGFEEALQPWRQPR